MNEPSPPSSQEPSSPVRMAQVVTEASSRISQILGEAANDLIVVLRQEVGRVATLFRPELAAAAKTLGALSIAVVSACLVMFFASLALLSFLATFMSLYWAAFIVTGIWTSICLLAVVYFRAQVRRFMINREQSPPLD